MTGRLVVAITGASGSIYAARFLAEAAAHFTNLYLCVSRHGAQVLKHEMQTDIQGVIGSIDGSQPVVQILDPDDMFTPPASGSFRHDGMVIVPCSVGTAGRIASGVSDDLITRAADVCLKERRPLILVVREAPLNVIHLRNLTQLAEAGATILPACPSFYHRPDTVEQAVDTIVARILQHLGKSVRGTREWQVGAS